MSETETPELETRLREAFPNLTDRDFAYQATDLYVVAYPGVAEWLSKNHQWPNQITTFVGASNSWNGNGKLCLDIPFAGKWNHLTRRASSVTVPAASEPVPQNEATPSN